MMKAMARKFYLSLPVFTLLATPAMAQDANMSGRVDKLEKEVKALQRKVFPGGSDKFFQPEITTPQQAATPVGTPASSPIVDLTARVNALESSLQNLTGQIEQNNYKMVRLEERLAKLEAQQTATVPLTVPGPVATGGGSGANAAASIAPAATPPAAAASTGDPGEDAYLAAYALWRDKRYTEAQTALAEVAAKYPKHKRATYARNLRGRAFLDNGQAEQATRVFLENYRADPKGERAPDSLYYLGQSLMALKPPRTAEACKAYGELEDVYGASLSASLKTQLPKAKAAAKCS